MNKKIRALSAVTLLFFSKKVYADAVESTTSIGTPSASESVSTMLSNINWADILSWSVFIMGLIGIAIAITVLSTKKSQRK